VFVFATRLGGLVLQLTMPLCVVSLRAYLDEPGLVKRMYLADPSLRHLEEASFLLCIHFSALRCIRFYAFANRPSRACTR